jgi:hypothetical protein
MPGIPSASIQQFIIIAPVPELTDNGCVERPAALTLMRKATCIIQPDSKIRQYVPDDCRIREIA